MHTFGFSIQTLAPNIINVQHDKTNSYLFGDCGAATSSSGVSQGDPMIEAIESNAPYTRKWFKAMLPYDVHVLRNAAYDGTYLYYVYTTSTYATMFHAINSSTGADAYAPIQLSVDDTMGAFSVKNNAFIAYDDGSTTYKAVTLTTGAVTDGLSVPLVKWYGNPIFTDNGVYVQLYYDTTSMRCVIIDKSASGVTVPIKSNGVLVSPPLNPLDYRFSVAPIGTKSLYAMAPNLIEMSKFVIP